MSLLHAKFKFNIDFLNFLEKGPLVVGKIDIRCNKKNPNLVEVQVSSSFI